MGVGKRGLNKFLAPTTGVSLEIEGRGGGLLNKYFEIRHIASVISNCYAPSVIFTDKDFIPFAGIQPIMSTETSNMSATSTPPFKWQTVYMAYGIVMFFILIIGFFGNVFTILVLRQHEHRNKSITPLMINLAVADLFIIVFGYPAIIASNLNGDLLFAGSPLCIWSGFANGVSGMTCIATLTMMSGVVYQIVKRNSPYSTASKRQSTALVLGSWLYGLITMFPPLAGWNRFVPGQARFSCAPEWTASDVASKMYILMLIAIGYLTPLIIVAVFNFHTYR